jgi:hypothetical protein
MEQTNPPMTEPTQSEPENKAKEKKKRKGRNAPMDRHHEYIVWKKDEGWCGKPIPVLVETKPKPNLGMNPWI